MLGGGQLARMVALAGRRLGYRFVVWDRDAACPAAPVADEVVMGDFHDEQTADDFGSRVDRVTLEFENIPLATAERLEHGPGLFPGSRVLATCQHRTREKQFLRAEGVPCAPFDVVRSAAEVAQGYRSIGGGRAVLKTASLGYDGRGQIAVASAAEAVEAWHRLETDEAVLEAWVDYQCECSVIVARGHDGRMETFPMAENLHEDHILSVSGCPARVPEELQRQGREIARHLADALGVVGLLAVEMFHTTDGRLWVNEMAPRTHNSGHYTFDGAHVSQFEQQLRAVAGLPLADPVLRQPVVMVNLLGQLWRGQEAPDWTPVLEHPRARLDLYGKHEARPGRKMGHFCLFGSDPSPAGIERLWDEALGLRRRLGHGERPPEQGTLREVDVEAE